MTPRNLRFPVNSPSPTLPEQDGVSPKSAESEALIFVDNSHYLHSKTIEASAEVGATVWVDESMGTLQDDFVKQLFQKCFYSFFQREDEEGISDSKANSFGQTPIVTGPDGKTRPVTAKHCVKQKTLDDEYEEGETRAYNVSQIMCHAPMRDIAFSIEFPYDKNYQVEDCNPAPLRQNETWKHGIDLAWGAEIAHTSRRTNRILERLGDVHFSMVDDENFRVEIGMKVGIVVFNKYKVQRSSPAFEKSSYKDDEEITDTKLELLYGPAMAVAIYCGSITFVGEDYVEYTLNSSRGNSGAMVVLLDVEEQHPSVGQHRGKAIAVHAGYHPALGTNIGFKFTSKPYPTAQRHGDAIDVASPAD